MRQDETGIDGNDTAPGTGASLSPDACAIIAAFPHPVFLYGNDGVIISASPAAIRMTGGSPVGLSFEQVIEHLAIRHLDGIPLSPVELPVAQVLTGADIVNSPLLITAADGAIFSIQASASRLLREGVAVGVLSAWSDVTDLAEALDLELQRRNEAESRAQEHEEMAEALSQQNEELQAQEEELRQQLDALALSREALWESEQRVRRTLERLLSPGDDLPDLELVDLLDLGAMQNLLDEFQQVTGIEAGLVDPQGRIVVGTRWQTCCADFHRVNPETLRNCIESDLVLL